MQKFSQSFVVTYANENLKKRASEVALQLQVDCKSVNQVSFDNYNFHLTYDNHGWSLKFNPELKIGNEIKINFSEYLKNKREIQASPLIKALSSKSNKCPVVFEATAGLGKDSLFMAASGMKVYATEKNQLLSLLLSEAHKRFALSAMPWQRQIVEFLNFTHGDALELLSVPAKLIDFTNELPDCIYLDPMFPEKKKAAKVKKEAQILQYLCKDNQDAGSLLLAALDLKVKRVVVKRMTNSDFLAGIKPLRQVLGEACRFDLY